MEEPDENTSDNSEAEYAPGFTWPDDASIIYVEGPAGNPAVPVDAPRVSTIPMSGFSEKFHARELLAYPDGEKNPVEIIDIAPESVGERSEVPLLVIPGFAEGPRTLEPNMRLFGEWGRRVISYDAPYGIGAQYEPIDAVAFEDKLEEYEVGKAATIAKVLEQKQIKKVDAVGHSEGCINIVIAALEHPENFRNIILVNPAGMVGEITMFEFIQRVWDHTFVEREKLEENPLMRREKERAIDERHHNILTGPAKSFEAMRAIACTEINELLRELKHRGVGISIIHSVDDVLFPMDDVQHLAAEDQFDGFYSVKGGHNDFFLNPEPYTMLVDHALSALEAKQKKELADDHPAG